MMKQMLVLMTIFVLVGCDAPTSPAVPTATEARPAASATTPAQAAEPTPVPTATALPQAAEPRTLLTYEVLAAGPAPLKPVDESALTPPAGGDPAAYVFEGRLELIDEEEHCAVEHLRGVLEEKYACLPAFDFEFVQRDGYLIPVQRGLIIADSPAWNIILEPGRAWQEASDGGYSRASFPFTLVPKNSNSTFNGTMTFLFNDREVSRVWYQVTQETTSYYRANFWGLVAAAYHPGAVENADQIGADYAAERAARLPVKPLEALAEDYPGLRLSAFGSGVSSQHLTWVGFVVDGVNYLGGCQTRFGTYPYCEAMRAASYSTAKSAFVGIALLRLAQTDGPQIADLLIKDYVPEAAASTGDWETVTFNNTLDMASGNYGSAGYMDDDNSEQMMLFFTAGTYAEHIALAFDWPHQDDPGTRWVYRTSDTFIVTRAMQNYLESREGTPVDLFDFVVEEVYRPLGLGPGAFTSLRTSDDNWQGQAEGGYGLYWIPDDIAKIGQFLTTMKGQIDGEQLLHPGLLAATLQQDPSDQGVRIDGLRMYNNAFWANRTMGGGAFECDFWVIEMLGVSGNVVALMPNGTVYYYFSDNQEFTWDAAVVESNKIRSMCP